MSKQTRLASLFVMLCAALCQAFISPHSVPRAAHNYNRNSHAALKMGSDSSSTNILTKHARLASSAILLSTIFLTPSFAPSPSFAQDDSPTQAPPIYGLKKGRLLPCKNPSNCISTSSVNSLDKYGPPWVFSKPAKEEYNDILETIKADKLLKLVESDEDRLYLRAEAKSAVPPTGIDDIEILVNGADNLISYRSNSREVLSAGPQIVGDGGSNKNRLDSLRRRLGVSEMDVTTEIEAMKRETAGLGFIQMLQTMSQPSDINFIDNSVPDSQ